MVVAVPGGCIWSHHGQGVEEEAVEEAWYHVSEDQLGMVLGDLTQAWGEVVEVGQGHSQMESHSYLISLRWAARY
jgi:hypothetical protein